MVDDWFSNSHQLKGDALDKDGASADSVFDVQSDIVLDESVFNELKVLLGDDFTLLIEAFFADADSITTSFDKMQREEGSANYESIFRLAHSLKSVSQHVGAMAMSLMAAQLEQEGRQGNVPELNAKLREILAMYGKVKNKLQRML